MEDNQQSFWQFSNQLRLQTANFANLSTNDSIWSSSYVGKGPLERKNFDVRVGAELNSSNSSKPKGSSDLNVFNDGWNSFRPSASDHLLNNNLNLKALGSDNNIKDLNDGWNSFKPRASDHLLNNLNLKALGSDNNIKGLNDGWNSFKPKGSDYNGFNDGWKINNGPIIGNSKKDMGINGGNFSKGLYYKLGNPANNGNFNLKSHKNGGSGKGEEAEHGGGKSGKKNYGNSNKAKNSAAENGHDTKSAAEKRFKTLPPSESLPRNETIGGYIFVCNNDTMQENLKRQLFGLPPRYRDSVRAITPGLPLFLYNYSTHQLHGIFEAASFGGTNIDPTAWEDKKCPGESRFPAQVRVIIRKICEPLEEDSFRPILHHYDGPKFRLELSIPETISLLDILAEQNP